MNKGVLLGARQAPSPFPPGIIWEYSGAALPDPANYGIWLWADGTLVSRSQYPDLFRVCQFSYSPTPGTDPGGGMFYLPNRKGKVGVGYDVGQTEFNALGKAGGSKDAIVASHTHGVASATGVTGTRDLGHNHYDDHSHSDSHAHGYNHTHNMGGAGGHNHSHGGGSTSGFCISFGSSQGLIGTGRSSDALYTHLNGVGDHAHGVSTVQDTYGSSDTGGRSSGSTNTKATGGSALTGWTESITATATYPLNHGHTVSIDTAGVTATSERLPPYVVCNYIVKA